MSRFLNGLRPLSRTGSGLPWGSKLPAFWPWGEELELYFFLVAGEEVSVGISGETLQQFQGERRHLSRQEKVDLSRFDVEAGIPLVAQDLLIRDDELAA